MNVPTSTPSPTPPAAPASTSVLEGTLERVTFSNQENGYTIARLQPHGRSFLVTIVGNMAAVNVGASLRLRGHWVNHAQYGKQFEVHEYSEQLPATVEGIRKYLGSGLIKGVGPVTADRIVNHFGLQTLEVIDNEPDRLGDVPGVGRKRATLITKAWAEQQQIKEIMLFLQSHDVTTGLAVKIYKQYGNDAIQVVQADPYRLAREVFGIGFRTADMIARKMGLPPGSPKRIEAGLLFALSNLADQGDCYAPREKLLAESMRLLQPAPRDMAQEADPADSESPIDTLSGTDPEPPTPVGGLKSGAPPDFTVQPDAVEAAIDRLVQANHLFADEVTTDAHGEELAEPEIAVYLPPFYFAEIGVANRLSRLLSDSASRLAHFADVNWENAYAWLDRRAPNPLAERQQAAVQMALTSKVGVLTGGPGTGKTTTVRAILHMLQARGSSVVLAAPTGRAAKRLAETTGVEAKTIHRLLEFKPTAESLFQRNEENPLDADMVIVDEVSMVDLLLMNHLVKAIGPDSHLLLVGDVDQLPSVGAGNVLNDLIASGAVPTIALTQIFRQAENSHIIVNAHRINQGKMPLWPKESDDFFLFKAEDPATAADWVVDVVSKRIPARFGLDPLADVQVLSPMHRGLAGVAAMNERLQAALNPPAQGRMEAKLGGRTFRVGDKVMQMRNNYDKDIFNGDLGRILHIDPEQQLVTTSFEGTEVDYEFSEMDELVHAFACSTHKSQGAEYPAVVMVLLPSHYMMLQRNLLYTGVTRARRLCVLVGSPRAVAMAVHNDRVSERHTGLARRLRAARAAAPRNFAGEPGF